MPDKKKTIVVFETHEHTIIRRWRRTVSGQVLPEGAVPGGQASEATEPVVRRKPKSLGRLLKTAAVKITTVTRRVMRGVRKGRNEQP
jgi:hypothetical protein